MTDTQTLPNQDDLASLFEDAGNHQEQVVAHARAYIDARRLKEDGEAALKKLSERAQAAEVDLLRAMDSAQVKSLKVEHAGGTHGLTQVASTYFSLPAGAIDMLEIVDWIELVGGVDIIKRAIHHATFSSFAKELTDEGMPLHPLVKVAERRGVQLRKG